MGLCVSCMIQTRQGKQAYGGTNSSSFIDILNQRNQKASSLTFS